MKIVDKNFDIKGVSIILGFFDGIHCGHRAVINQAVSFASKNDVKTLLLTFKNSPAKYFNKDFSYIYPREISYEIIESLGVDYLLEIDFEEVVDITAEDYLKILVEKYKPISITTGFNHTFGRKKLGNPEFLSKMSVEYNYEYFCVQPCVVENQVVSSTLIKDKIVSGDVVEANELLNQEFALKIKVIEGEKIGRKIGFPTANSEYPNDIVKLPYGVYKIKVLDKIAIMNWGVKPTFNSKKELLEIHIPNLDENLYGKVLEIKVLDKIRNEKKFDSIEDLIKQIKEDIKCLEL